MARLTASWNDGLDALAPVVTPDERGRARALRRGDHQRPTWRRSRRSTCRPGSRRGCARSTPGRRAPAPTPQTKRATITVDGATLEPDVAGATGEAGDRARRQVADGGARGGADLDAARHTRRPGRPWRSPRGATPPGTAIRSAGSPAAMRRRRAAGRPRRHLRDRTPRRPRAAGGRRAPSAPPSRTGRPGPSGLNGSCRLSAPAATTTPASRRAAHGRQPARHRLLVVAALQVEVRRRQGDDGDAGGGDGLGDLPAGGRRTACRG